MRMIEKEESDGGVGELIGLDNVDELGFHEEFGELVADEKLGTDRQVEVEGKQVDGIEAEVVCEEKGRYRETMDGQGRALK